MEEKETEVICRVSPFENLHREMAKMLEEATGWQRPSLLFCERVWRPRFNLYENDDEIVVVVDLAGAKKESLDIRTDARTIYLRGEREDPIPAMMKRCHHLEIPAGLFERDIPLPGSIDPGRVSVNYEGGLLEIHLPKAERIRVEIEGNEPANANEQSVGG